MHIDRLDRLVLTVRDLDATCAFYREVLAMRVVISPNGRRALHFGNDPHWMVGAGVLLVGVS